MIQVQSLSSSQLVEQVGETDQQFLIEPTPELAIRRAQLRVALSKLSHQKQEQLYFLTEAAALIEIALMHINPGDQHNENPVDQHIALSVALAEVYLQFYQVTREPRYLTICTQVIKPLSQQDNAQVLLALARLSGAEQHPALVRHWLMRLFQLNAQSLQSIDLNAITQIPELAAYQQKSWFAQLLRSRIN